MTREQSRWGEQTLNRIAEIALASQLQEVKRLEVKIKTDLSKLARGEIESIVINIEGLLIQPDLIVEQLQLLINRVTVKPLSAILGKIKLTHPSTGTIEIIINEDNLNRAINSQSFYQRLQESQSLIKNAQVAINIQSIKCCLLPDGNITFYLQLISNQISESQLAVFTATPQIRIDSKEIVLEDVHYLKGLELPSTLTAAFIAQVNEVLNISKFEQQGMSVQINQLDVTAGRVTWQAAVYITQFVSF